MPTVSTLIASSTENMTAFFGFVWPVIPIAFGIAAVVAMVSFILFFFEWVFDKIANMITGGSQVLGGDRMSKMRAKARLKIMDDIQNQNDWDLWKRSKGL